jgi:hypothetical protein
LDSTAESPGLNTAREIFEGILDILEQDLEYQQELYSTFKGEIHFYASVVSQRSHMHRRYTHLAYYQIVLQPRGTER